MTHRIGDVVHVFVEKFKKYKFLMCVSSDPLIFFSINTHRRDGYLQFGNVDCSCLRNHTNFLNCATLLSIEELSESTIKYRCKMSSALVKRVLEYIESADVLSEEDREIALGDARRQNLV